VEKCLLRREQETNSLDTFFIIKLEIEAPNGASILSAGPYLNLEDASEILMDFPQLILGLSGHEIDHIKIGYVYECYMDNGLKILKKRATEVYR
jgi:hypothetical protein